MTTSWNSEEEPPATKLDPLNWAVALMRLVMLAIVIYSLMVVLAIARLLEAPFGVRRVSTLVVQLACKVSLRVLGFRVKLHGKPMKHKGALVSNHSSWLDIFSLNAAARVFFVSKAEVSKWPAIGLIARSTGTVFIERRASHAKKHKSQFEQRLLAGDRLLFFPEGTSTDSRQLIPFKSTLFAAFFEPHLVNTMWIQPTSLIYHAPNGEDPRFYGWWGDMDFASHFLKTLGAVKSGGIEIVFHPEVRVSDFKDRKALTRHCEDAVKAGLHGFMKGD